ncbi:hypothetical protein FGO68_gene6655 [Halteria grandinella]|uniref:Uncharacterized protein n=1 Tax=Halteria grandinella TaxID=5974 RepID=A0A8J8T403_HALGN|nr:hypothetical protein FGO68_gene6655 [Halteria grandinella]
MRNFCIWQLSLSISSSKWSSSESQEHRANCLQALEIYLALNSDSNQTPAKQTNPTPIQKWIRAFSSLLVAQRRAFLQKSRHL